MFAGVLNKGLRENILLLILLIISIVTISFFTTKEPEFLFYPDLFYNFFSSKVNSKAIIISINSTLIIISSYIIFKISVEEEIGDKNNIYPLFIFLCINLVCCHSKQIISQFITNIFFLYSFYKLIIAYRKENALNELFIASFWLSVSAFITTISILYFPLFIIAWLILRPFNLREFVTIVIGFIVPVFMVECVAYLTNFNQWYFIFATKEFFKSLKFPLISEYYFLILIYLTVIFIISLINSIVVGFGNTVKKQKARKILLWNLFFSLFILFAGGANGTSILIMFSFPLCIFIGDFLFQIKQLRISNTLIGLFIICLFVIISAKFNII